jgi:hypothetical protein
MTAGTRRPPQRREVDGFADIFCRSESRTSAVASDRKQSALRQPPLHRHLAALEADLVEPPEWISAPAAPAVFPHDAEPAPDASPRFAPAAGLISLSRISDIQG